MPGVSSEYDLRAGRGPARLESPCAWSAAYRRRWRSSCRPARSAASTCPRWDGPESRRTPNGSPDRSGFTGHATASMRLACDFPDAHLLHAHLFAGQHLDVNAVALHDLARLRHAAQPFRHQAADGSRLDLFLRPEVQQSSSRASRSCRRRCSRPRRPRSRRNPARARRESRRGSLPPDPPSSPGPAVLPYSSTTITMCVLSCCISRIRSFTGLVSGTKRIGPHQFAHACVSARALLVQLEHVAHVHEADDLVDRCLRKSGCASTAR